MFISPSVFIWSPIDVGEEILEPEVDLSSFLERQRLSEDRPDAPESEDDSDIDQSLVQQFLTPHDTANSKKGRVQQIEWDESLETLSREKANADATRGTLEAIVSRQIQLPWVWAPIC